MRIESGTPGVPGQGGREQSFPTGRSLGIPQESGGIHIPQLSGAESPHNNPLRSHQEFVPAGQVPIESPPMPYKEQVVYQHAGIDLPEPEPAQAERDVVQEEEVERTLEDMRDGKWVQWRKAEPGVIRGVLEKVAAEDEGGLPASMLERRDFDKKRDYLGDRSLLGIFDMARRQGQEAGVDAITELHNITGLEVTGQDVVKAMQMERRINWDHVPPEAVAEVLAQAGEEIGIPVSMMGKPEMREHNYDFLGGRTIGGIYDHYKKLQRDEGVTIIDLIHQDTGLSPTAEDIIATTNAGQNIDWQRMPSEAIKGVLDRVAEEVGVPVSMLNHGDYARHNDFLGGRTLQGLYHSVNNQLDGDVHVPSAIAESVGVVITGEDVAAAMQADRHIMWSIIPPDAVESLLETVAQDDSVDKPVSFLGRDDLLKQFPSFGDRSLEGLFHYAEDSERDEGQSPMDYLLAKAGVEVTTDDVLTSFRKNQPVRWERVSPEVVGELLHMVSRETGLPLEVIDSSDLSTRRDMFGGKSLKGLYEYSLRDRSQEQRGMHHIKSLIGVEHVTRTSAGMAKEQEQILIHDIQQLALEGIRSVSAVVRALGISEAEARRGIALLRQFNNQ